MSLRISFVPEGTTRIQSCQCTSADGSSQVINPHVGKWLDLSVEWLLSVFGEPEFKDVSTSHIMEAIKELGIPLPQEVNGSGVENA